MEGQKFDHLFKLVLVGGSGVEKPNLLSRFTRNSYTSDEKSTIGVEFASRVIPMADSKKIKVQVWDSSGQERYRAITNAYYRGALGAMLVYDVTQRSTFDNIPRWLREVRELGSPDIALMLVGNKVDLLVDESLRQVPEDHAKKLAAEYNIPFMETSAKTGMNVTEAFTLLVKNIYDKNFVKEVKPEPRNVTAQPVTDQPQLSSGFAGLFKNLWRTGANKDTAAKEAQNGKVDTEAHEKAANASNEKAEHEQVEKNNKADKEQSRKQNTDDKDKTAKGNVLSKNVKDGSVEFWSQKLTGVFDAESLPQVSRKLCKAGFKQHHWGELSNDELIAAGLNLGETKDLLKRQQLASCTTNPLQINSARNF